MKKRWVLLGLCCFAAGILAGRTIKEKEHISPENTLRSIRKMLSEKFTVSGSWIYMKPKDFSKNGIDYTIYHGGITKESNGQETPYEFYVDANTGTIVEFFPSHPEQQ